MSNISVLILMGSDSDAPVMQGAVDVLREFGISCEMTVASAHRSPERGMRLGAGGAARLVAPTGDAAGCRGAFPWRAPVHRRRRRCCSSWRRRGGAHDAAGHRRADRLVGAQGHGGTVVDGAD